MPLMFWFFNVRTAFENERRRIISTLKGDNSARVVDFVKNPVTESLQRMSTTPPCPKCGGERQEGFVLDVTHGARLVSQWVGGEPEKSFWTGIKIKGRPMHSIQTFRCARCGFLESYAKGS